MTKAMVRKLRSLSGKLSTLADSALDAETMIEELDNVSVAIAKLRDDVELSWSDQLDGEQPDEEEEEEEEEEEDADDAVDELDGNLSFDTDATDDT